MTEKPDVSVAESAFRRHYDQVYRYVRRRARNHHEAEELTQQVFVDAAASLRDTGSPELAWLYTVAKRRFADEARKRGARISPLSAPEATEYGPDVAGRCTRRLGGFPRDSARSSC